MTLEYAAARFLKWEKNCSLILWERSPREFHCGEPDVLGITNSRYMLEIEIKRNAADFRKNARKKHMANRFGDCEHIRQVYNCKAPSQFWFLMPRKLALQLEPEIPDWAGLMIPREDHPALLSVIKPAARNKEAEKLTVKECGRLMRLAGNQILALMESRNYLLENGGCNLNDSTSQDEFYSSCPLWMGGRDQPETYTNFQI